jgi:uncharacterized protein YcnI
MKKIVWILAIILPSVVSAHVVLENQEAVVGSYYKAVLKVSHGCNGQATQKLIVEIPDGFRGAKPMIKTNWKITIVKGSLAKPYISHGKTISEGTTLVEWVEGNLPSEYYDEFVLVGQLTEEPGNLYFKVTQICQSSKLEWTQIPDQGKTIKDYSSPAVLLKVLPKEENYEHHNH